MLCEKHQDVFCEHRYQGPAVCIMHHVQPVCQLTHCGQPNLQVPRGSFGSLLLNAGCCCQAFAIQVCAELVIEMRRP